MICQLNYIHSDPTTHSLHIQFIKHVNINIGIMSWTLLCKNNSWDKIEELLLLID